ncbi:MAG: bifunctional 3-hydroxydecanoyl-ACP dehydratase/trans-2-decenoyl-ACP isomerase [Desulfosalsimonadaceae bacterium]
MRYEEFLQKEQFDLAELIAFSYGRLVDDPPAHFDARLPAPPFLMVDRITEIRQEGRSGRVLAEQDIRLDAWYFQCHFPDDPVQPGCLGLDAIWQLLGFYCVWRGALGAGRALGCESVEFDGQIRPHNRLVTFSIDVRRFHQSRQNVGTCTVIADAGISVDGEPVAAVKKARSGVFPNIAYKDYPRAGSHRKFRSNQP